MNNFSHNAPYRPAIIIVCDITMNATGLVVAKLADQVDGVVGNIEVGFDVAGAEN